MEIVIPILTAIAGWVIGYLIAPYIWEKARLKRELASQYLVPFKKWCANFHGELDEFGNRYLGKEKKEPCLNNYSDVQIIDDYRELHEMQIDITKWLAKVGGKKKDREVATEMRRLANVVDKFWHHIESDENSHIEKRQDIIEKLSGKETRKKVARQVVEHHHEIEQCNLELILNYLKRNIP